MASLEFSKVNVRSCQSNVSSSAILAFTYLFSVFLCHLMKSVWFFCIRYDMYSVQNGVQNTDTLGLAAVGAICGYSRTSINEDTGQTGAANTGTHELGHK